MNCARQRFTQASAIDFSVPYTTTIQAAVRGYQGAGGQHETGKRDGKRCGDSQTYKFVENFNFRNADNLYTHRDLWQISLTAKDR